MSESSDDGAHAKSTDEAADVDEPEDAGAASDPAEDGSPDVETLRNQVEEKYDFDDFGPSDMAEMSAEEWEVAFDPDSWIVGEELFDRVERDLRRRVAEREVFAALERVETDDGPRVAAYSEDEYAVVYPDGTIEGRGTVLRDVKATVALCSMDEYEVAPPPADHELPDPEEIESGTGELGNTMLQLAAAAQLLTGFGLIGLWAAGFVPGRGAAANIVPPVVGGLFVLVGLFLLLVVANARLSDRFRAEEYRSRLRSVRDGERPPGLVEALETDGREPVDRER